MSETEAGWFLRHRDGIEHGPFRDADIMDAARRGNLAEDTCLLHETKTSGRWVFAVRVESLASVMKQAATPSESESVVRKLPQRSAEADATPKSEPKRKTASRPEAASRQENASRPENAASSDSVVKPPAAHKDSVAPPSILPRDRGYYVPRTIGGACLALVDLRFRAFVTPWIVRILWPICLAVALLWSSQLVYETFIQGEVVGAPDATEASADTPSSDGWQFQPLADQPFLQSQLFRLLVTLAGIFVSLLVMRVFCEAAIVLFRSAIDVHDLKQQRKRSPSE